MATLGEVQSVVTREARRYRLTLSFSFHPRREPLFMTKDYFTDAFPFATLGNRVARASSGCRSVNVEALFT